MTTWRRSLSVLVLLAAGSAACGDDSGGEQGGGGSGGSSSTGELECGSDEVARAPDFLCGEGEPLACRPPIENLCVGEDLTCGCDGEIYTDGCEADFFSGWADATTCTITAGYFACGVKICRALGHSEGGQLCMREDDIQLGEILTCIDAPDACDAEPTCGCVEANAEELLHPIEACSDAGEGKLTVQRAP